MMNIRRDCFRCISATYAGADVINRRLVTLPMKHDFRRIESSSCIHVIECSYRLVTLLGAPITPIPKLDQRKTAFKPLPFWPLLAAALLRFVADDRARSLRDGLPARP